MEFLSSTGFIFPFVQENVSFFDFGFDISTPLAFSPLCNFHLYVLSCRQKVFHTGGFSSFSSDWKLLSSQQAIMVTVHNTFLLLLHVPLSLFFLFNSYISTDFFFFWFMQIIRETKYSYQFPSTSPWPLNLPINDLYLQTASNIEAIYTRNTYRWPIRFRTGHITENTADQGFGGKVLHILGSSSNTI